MELSLAQIVLHFETELFWLKVLFIEGKGGISHLVVRLFHYEMVVMGDE